MKDRCYETTKLANTNHRAQSYTQIKLIGNTNHIEQSYSQMAHGNILYQTNAQIAQNNWGGTHGNTRYRINAQ